MKETEEKKPVPRVRLLEDVEADLRRSSRLQLIASPPTRPNYQLRRIGLIVVMGLILIGIVAAIVTGARALTIPTHQNDDTVVILANGTEVPLADYLLANTTPADPTVTDLRDRDGRNGMWYQVLKEGQIVRLWREPGGKYIHVEFATGVEGKCTELQKLTAGTPWAKFTHVKQFDSGWTRQDFIAFEAKVPRAQLSLAKKIQRGGAGEILF